MSGEYLRTCATQGNFEEVWRLLKERTNACSTDKYGLTALHYAVWNGHTECVKYLVCNSWGVDKNGKRGYALNLVSVLGLSALHLAAQDCPHWAVKEITELLLMAGVDVTLRDKYGKVAWDYAVQENNSGYLDAYASFKQLQEALEQREKERLDSIQEETVTVLGEEGVNDALVTVSTGESAATAENNEVVSISKLPLETYFDEVVRTHTRPKDPEIDRSEIWEAEGPQFPAPSFITRRIRCARLPATSRVLEQHLKPIVLYSEKLPGINSYRGLDFAMKESEANRSRREVLLQAADPTWRPVADSEYPQDAGRNSRKLGTRSKR